MTTGTKVFLAVFAAFIGVLVLYYGVLMPEAQSLPEISAATRDMPKGEVETTASPTQPLPPTDPLINTAGSTGSVGVLTEAMQGTMMGPAMEPAAVETAATSLVQNPPPTQPNASGVTTPTSTPSTPVANQPVSLSGGVVPTSSQKPSTSAAPSSQQTTTDYFVKSDDTMSSIAQSWFGDASKWSLIAKENPLADPNRLTIGQKLRLPSKDAKPSTVKEQAAGDQPLYTVRSGDTLSKIAREYYGDVGKWKAIYDANKSTIGSDPAVLKTGIKLKLPPPSKPASS